jgi:high affinity Mn2+ porin
LRGRLGYATSNWLFYLTGGFAWSFDQFGRTQNTAGASRVAIGETQSLVPRYGGAVGAGVDFALNDKWSARVEYLFIDYANRDVVFPAVADRFNSSLALQTIRVGLDYKLGEKTIDTDIFTKTITPLELDHFRIPRSVNVHRTIRCAISIVLFRSAEPRAQSRPREPGFHVFYWR